MDVYTELLKMLALPVAGLITWAAAEFWGDYKKFKEDSSKARSNMNKKLDSLESKLSETRIEIMSKLEAVSNVDNSVDQIKGMVHSIDVKMATLSAEHNAVKNDNQSLKESYGKVLIILDKLIKR